VLKLAVGLLGGVMLLLGFISVEPAAARAPLPQVCTNGFDENWNPCGVATTVTTVPGTAGSASAKNTAPASDRVCRQRIGSGSDTAVVPCTFQGGWWVEKQQCYVKALVPQPDKSDTRWDHNLTGAIYMCVALGADATYLTSFFWALNQPPEIPAVDPSVLAQQALAALQLRPIRMGMVPEDKPGYVGLVGMPVWMWVDTPDPHTYGPATNTASDGSVTVTINAKVAKTLWEMGDGKSVVCTTAGTAYQDSDGKQPSPDCGYSYTKQGTYTIRATTTWDIAWTANTGQSGTIPLILTATRTVVIGEVQVIVH